MNVMAEYRSASYLVEPYPDSPDDLYVTVDVCPKCGAIVHDTQLHDDWHRSAGVRAHFGLL
jgi:hypothetical protein